MKRREAPVRIPGGCDDCNAYRTLDAAAAPLFRLVVHHDVTCPELDALDGAKGIR